MDGGLALLRLELETLWITDGDGRLVRNRTNDGRPTPLLAVGACDEGLCWTVSRVVPDHLAAEVTTILASTKPDGAGIGWEPASANDLIERFTSLGPVARAWRGPSYVVPARLTRSPPPTPELAFRASTAHDVAGLQGLMPEKDRQILIEPWVVAMVDGQVAAVCETSRSAPASVEAGVWTYEQYRRRGLGTAVTAAWSALVVDRTAFYSTNWDNVGSQGIARRLGLRPLAQLWHVSLA